MSNESQADVYASFGVNSAVMTTNNITEHEQNMLALPVSIRDGDDSIELAPEVTDEGSNEFQLEDGEDNSQELELGNEEGGEEATDSDDFTPLGDPDADLIEASEAVDEYADGFQQMRAQAIKAGLPVEVADQIEVEYEEDGKLSEASFKALEKAGFSRGFVKSFISGQEALAQTYVAQIQAYAGGAEKFKAIVAHMTANSPDAVEALENAIQNQDLKAVKTLINLGMASRTKKFGKTPERSVTKRAPASKPQSTQKGPQGYSSQREMVKAMSDARYGTDPQYRAEVEAKVLRSSW
ncbi:capsid protein [Pseudomonas phage 10P302A]|uniref:Capsid protein n=1 Tax=Pseudomonas phage 10P302A TaxID=3038233 RepID=A0AAF0GNR0_9CAUD|nr:capsid protein [Pseudomonas phage 10P302A]